MSTAEPSTTDAARPIRKIGAYRLLQQLGTGGMSSVFRAAHEASGVEVAVKILPKQLAQNPTLVRRFENELKNAKKLVHPNIVAVYDNGEDSGRQFLVLEYVPGKDLQDQVRDNGPLPISVAVSVVRQVAEGLKFAATRGVIHRDIKPANILLGPGNVVKVIDLGLAVESEAEDERVTREGTTVGTVDYMAPEQARNSRATSEASDIYSLGCTFYYLMTGAPPFPGGDIVDKLGRHISAPIPDIREKRPEAPESLSLLIKRMMAKKPIQRFQTHTELIAALNALGLESGVATPLFVDDIEEEPETEIGLVPDSEEFDRPVEASRGRNPDETGGRGPLDIAPPSLRDLGDLVGSDDDAGPAARPRSSRRRLESPRPMALLMDELVEEEETYAGPPPRTVRRSGSNFFDQTTSLKTFIGVGVAIGLAIAFLGIALIQLYIVLTDNAREGASKTPVNVSQPANAQQD